MIRKNLIGHHLPLLLVTGLSVVGVASAAPPGEALNLTWCAGTSNCLQWNAASPAGAYQLLRGTSSELPALLDATVDSCARATFGPTSTGPILSEVPSPGTMYWYLVVAQTCSSTGSAGDATAGPRVVNSSGDCGVATCADGIRDGTETDVDCGGACSPCADVKSCCAAGDCASAHCLVTSEIGACVAATCFDGIKNGTETDVDCGGGGFCGPCGLGAICGGAGDCASRVCQGGVCAVESCTAGPGPAGGTATSCGFSGNTYWNFTALNSGTKAALSSAYIYVSSGSRLSRLNPAAGSEQTFRDFSGVTLGKPIVFALKSSAGDLVTPAGSNGYVYGLNPITLATSWSRLVQRTGYASDSVTATPVVQRYDASDPIFRAAGRDLLMVGTHYDGTTTANRVYGLDASTGSIVWLFNPTGAYSMDTVNGLVVDRSRNLVFVVSDKPGTSSQSTVWALRTTTGVKVWSVDLGAIDAEPVLANGGLFVGTRAGVLYKLDPNTGSTVWQRTITTVSTITHVTADGENGVVYVLDALGTLHAVTDQCSAASFLWDFKPVGANVSAAPAVLNDGWRYVYVGADDGKTWQVRASDGVGLAWAVVTAGAAAPSEEPLIFYDGSSPVLLASSGGNMKRLCIPWPDTVGDKAWLRLPPSSNPAAAVEALCMAQGPRVQVGRRSP